MAGRSGPQDRLHAEITGDDRLGIWIAVEGVPYFVPHDKARWLQDRSVRRALNIDLLSGFHLRWGSLDADINFDNFDMIEPGRPHRCRGPGGDAVRAGSKAVKEGKA